VDSEQIARRLRARRAELSHRAGRVDADLRRDHEPLSADFAEQAVQRENDEVLGAIGASAASEIRAIDTALTRIAAGSYGTCTGCGHSIQPARLAAVPYASHCVDCAAGGEAHAAGERRTWTG
jgi:DnaK suppressor protein